MKKRAGLATDAEVRALGTAWRVVGGDTPGSGGLALPPVCETTDEWLARYGGPQANLAAPPDLSAMHDVSDRAPHPERPAFTDSGPVLLAGPGREPPPAGKPGHRGGLSRG